MSALALFTICVVLAYHLWRSRLIIATLRGDVLAAKAEAKHWRYLLDDSRREVQRLRTSNAHLIREATTMSWDIVRTEERNAYLCSCLRRQRDCAAGTMLLGRQTVRAKEAM